MHRNIALDILRLIMAFMVIGIHARFLADVSPLGEYLTVNGLFRIAVPVFLMINGFYFLPVLSKNNHRKWLKRIFILYVIWMLFYAYAWLDVPDLSFESLMKIAHRILFGYLHLWYIAGLIGATVLFLFMRRFSPAVILISILLTFATGVFIEYSGNYQLFQNSAVSPIFEYDWIHRNFLFVSYPFFALGYMINKYSLYKRISMDIIVVLSLIGLGALLGEAYINFHHPDSDNLVTVILLTPALFILFLKIDIAGHSKKIALYASSIYFIHIFFLGFLFKYTEIKGTLLTLVVFILSAIASFFVIKINNRFKFIL